MIGSVGKKKKKFLIHLYLMLPLRLLLFEFFNTFGFKKIRPMALPGGGKVQQIYTAISTQCHVRMDRWTEMLYEYCTISAQ